jgi:hypothetical protein
MESVHVQKIFQDVGDDLRGLPGFQVKSVDRKGAMKTLVMVQHLAGYG